MKKSIIEPANALKKKLFEIPKLVTAFQEHDTSIFHDWMSWLQELENIFQKYNFTQCAEIAGYRANIMSNYYQIGNRRIHKRKHLNQIGLSSVQPIQKILTDKSQELNDKIEQVRILIKQILIPAKDAGMIEYDHNKDINLFMESLLFQFKSHEQVRPLINNAIVLIGKYDVIRILIQEIEF